MTSSSRKSVVVLLGMWLFVCIAILSVIKVLLYQVTVAWDQDSTASSGRTDAFFHVGKEPHFSDIDRISFFFKKDTPRSFAHTFTTFTPLGNLYLRIDPMMGAGEVQIENFRLNGERVNLSQYIIDSHQVRIVPSQSNHLRLWSEDNDPYITLKLGKRPIEKIWSVLFCLAFLGFVVCWWLNKNVLVPKARTNEISPQSAYAGLSFHSFILVGSILVGASILLYAMTSIAKLTPPLQGPDEIVHVGNSFSTFYNLRYDDEAIECPVLWSDINHIFDVVQSMRNQPSESMDSFKAQELKILAQNFSGQLESEPSLNRKHCQTSNLFHRYLYNIVPLLNSQFQSQYNALDYLYDLRLGNIFSFGFLMLLCAFVLLNGKSIFVWRNLFDQVETRLFIILGAVMYFSIPQNIFMISMVSKEAYFLPLGVFVTVSIFYYHRKLTPILMLLFLVACWPRRAPYLLMFFIPVLYYGYRVVLLRRYKKLFNWLPATSLACFFLVPLMLLAFFEVREHLPFRFPSALMVAEDPFHFYKEIFHYLVKAMTLQIFDQGSFFGVLGSMDAPVYPWMPIFFREALMVIVLVSLIGLITVRPSTLRESLINLCRDARREPGVVFLLLLIPLMASFVTYAAFQVYYSPDLGLQWGVGIQGRYYLPVYFFVICYPFILAQSFLYLSGGGQFSFRNNGFVSLGYFLICVVALVVAFAMADSSYDVVVDRYYHWPSDLDFIRSLMYFE